MLQDQFIKRLLLIIVFGVIYIYTMMKMASYNSVETTPQKAHSVKNHRFYNYHRRYNVPNNGYIFANAGAIS